MNLPEPDPFPEWIIVAFMVICVLVSSWITLILARSCDPGQPTLDGVSEHT